MTSTLEQIRQRHEDIETLKQLAATALQSRSDPANPHPRLRALTVPLRTVRDAEQLAFDLICAARTHAEYLHSFYNSVKDDVDAIGEKHAQPTSAFYAALRELREVHRVSINTASTSNVNAMSSQFERDRALLGAFQPVKFSGEEGNGRFLDLQPFFRTYVNLTKNYKLLYHQYVRDCLTWFPDEDDGQRSIDDTSKERQNKINEKNENSSVITNGSVSHITHVPPVFPVSRQYERYLDSLVAYFSDFARRAHPLDDTDSIIAEETKNIRSSLKIGLQKLASDHVSPSALSDSLTEQGVKQALIRYGLKCGGRPEDRAKRLWDASRKKEHNGMNFGRTAELQRVIHFFTTKLLDEEVTATVANIQKKLSLSYGELEAERRAEESGLGIDGDGGDGAVGVENGDGDGDRMESTIYNPKDVPLGWDGKPIPYWMYKLHGLNHEFKCEICGGATYKGPRLFERHFTEAVHVGGLKRLGISYTKAFMMITRIQDAISLHERLVDREKNIQFDAEREVEVEDDNGNVMNLKTFNDLKRQGLL